MMIFLTLECWNNTENYGSLFTYTYHNQFYFYFTARAIFVPIQTAVYDSIF